MKVLPNILTFVGFFPFPTFLSLYILEGPYWNHIERFGIGIDVLHFAILKGGIRDCRFTLATAKGGIWGYRFTLEKNSFWNLGLAVLHGRW